MISPWRSLGCGMVLAACLAACSGPSAGVKKAVNELMAKGDFPGAAAKLEGVKEGQYGRKNAVLYHLDIGTVLHHAGDFRGSDEHLDLAEKRMQELYTKSASQAAGTLLLNDNTQDYAGEAFERALCNVFRALNYVFLGKPDEALVEARKVELYLDEINRRRNLRSAYQDDAFARYLDSLLYADSGGFDDARISRAAAMTAYQWYEKTYGTPAPRFDLDGSRDDKSGEVVFIHYNGVGPRKVSKTFQVAWGEGMAAVQATRADSEDAETQQKVRNAVAAGITGDSVVVSYPEFVQDPFRIASSEVQAGGAPQASVLMEDVSAIAARDLQDRMAAIRVRAIARATVKFLLVKLSEQEAQKQGAGDLGTMLIHHAASAFAALTEVADTRGWSTVPAQIRMARLRLAPGSYEVTVRFKDAAGEVVATRVFPGVVVQKGRRTYLSHRTAL